MRATKARVIQVTAAEKRAQAMDRLFELGMDPATAKGAAARALEKWIEFDDVERRRPSGRQS